MQPETKVGEVRGSMLTLNILGGIMCLLLVAAGVMLARALPHHRPEAAWDGLLFLGSVVVLVPLHEALHGLGMIWFAGLSRHYIKFGVNWRCLMPYCHCKTPASVRAYQRFVLLPFWVTGAAAVAALFIFPTDWIGVLAGVTVAVCVGDFWIASKLKRFDDDLMVHDLPNDLGCDIHVPASPSERAGDQS